MIYYSKPRNCDIRLEEASRIDTLYEKVQKNLDVSKESLLAKLLNSLFKPFEILSFLSFRSIFTTSTPCPLIEFYIVISHFCKSCFALYTRYPWINYFNEIGQIKKRTDSLCLLLNYDTKTNRFINLTQNFIEKF